MNLEQEYKDKIIRILTALFPHAIIYLFGSRARGTNREFSDIDIAIDAGKDLEPQDIGEANSMLAESNIPYKIDVVDLWEIPDKMREIVLKEGIIWKH